jgi:hypothetical protein
MCVHLDPASDDQALEVADEGRIPFAIDHLLEPLLLGHLLDTWGQRQMILLTSDVSAVVLAVSRCCSTRTCSPRRPGPCSGACRSSPPRRAPPRPA